MSYILKALRRAEQDHRTEGIVVAVPSELRPLPAARRLSWLLIIAAGLGLNALLAIVLLASHSGLREPNAVATIGARAGARPALPTPPPARPAAEPAPAAARPATPMDTPRTDTRVQSDARAQSDTRARTDTSATSDATRVTVPPAPPPRAVARDAAPSITPRPPEPRPVTRAEPDARASVPPPSPVAAAPPPQPPPPQAAPAGASTELGQIASKLKVDVLVWASDPKQRMVFLNGRKYVEGDAVGGRVLLERINEDGIVLAHQGQRLQVPAAGQ